MINIGHTPYFSNKDGRELANFVSDERELANIMNNFFINITKNIKLKKDSKGKLNNLGDIHKAFQSHPSIEKIKKAINTTEKFFFRNVRDDELRTFIINLDDSKTTPVGDISTDMLKQTVDLHLPIMTQIINIPFDSNCCSDDPQLAEVSPILKRRMT